MSHKVKKIRQLNWFSEFFFEKSYKKCGGETIPRPFSKK